MMVVRAASLEERQEARPRWARQTLGLNATTVDVDAMMRGTSGAHLRGKGREGRTQGNRSWRP